MNIVVYLTAGLIEWPTAPEQILMDCNKKTKAKNDDHAGCLSVKPSGGYEL